MSAQDKAKNTAETVKGTVKETAGRVKGDRSLEAEGKIDRVKGHLKEAGEKIKDAI